MRSRYGCAACKARKVKCDEIKPTCTNCRNFGLVCGQLVARQSGVPSSPATDISGSITAKDDRDELLPPVHAKRGRPRKVQKLNPRLIASSSQQKDSISNTAQGRSYSATEVQLLIHFTSHTVKTLSSAQSIEDSDYHHFTNVIPSLGLKHSFIFDFLCAIASMHMSYQAVDESAKASHRAIAETYFQTGLSDYGKEFDGRMQKGSVMYAAATLVCYFTLAAGPRSRSDVLVCDLAKAEEVAWLQLLYGVRALRETNTEPVTELTTPDTPDEKVRYAQKIPPMHVGNRWRAPFDSLRSMIQSDRVVSAPVYFRTLEDMAKIFKALEERYISRGMRDYENEQVLGWLYRLEDGFMVCVRQKEPVALIILAFYTVLLGTMEEHHWWTRGWADHILQVMCDPLSDDYRSWLSWPMAEAERRFAG